jgi:fatty-acyl-CoA synthase
VTYSHCVPTILQGVLTHPAAKDADLSGWKIAIGGSALPVGLAKLALSRGMDVFTGYGMSETCPTLTIAQLKPHERGDADKEAPLRTRTGLPLPLVDLRVVDDDMRDVPHDGHTTGEVVVRAPWLTQGYLRDPEASERLWRGGYLHTGDIGHISPDGWLRITDRVKDVIKTGGEWISSLELEDILSTHPHVSEVAVVGIKDDKWGERPLALVVPKPGLNGALTAKALQDHVMERVKTGAISKWAVPERVLFVEAIEKTSVGKLDKKLLRQKYGAA